MYKSFLFLLFGMIGSSVVSAQDNLKPLSDYSYASQNDNYLVVDSLSIENINNLIRKQFSLLVTGQSTYSLGSFAALSIDKPSVTFSPTIITKTGEALSLTFNGSILDNYAEIFNNSKLNQQISLEGRFHFLDNDRRKSIIVDQNQAEKFYREQMKVYQQHWTDTLKVRYDLLTTLLKKNELEDNINSLKSKLRTFIPGTYEEDLSKDSLIYQVKLKENELSIINTKLNRIRNSNFFDSYEDWENQTILLLNDEAAKKIEPYLYENLTPVAFRFGWWSLGFKVDNSVFRFFDSEATYDEQVTKLNYTSFEISYQYSFYSWDESFLSYFLTGGISLQRTNNIDTLKTVKITDRTYYSPSNLNRYTTSSYNAYLGAYEKNLNRIILSGEAYIFPKSKIGYGFHSFPRLILSSNQPELNIGVGIIFPIRKKDDDSSILNTEFYFDFFDITNQIQNDFKFHQKSSFGLRIAVPINFKQ
jgi:hypothetical protein